jgi:hypothetical protein
MTDRELIEDLLSALEYHTEQTRPIEFSKVAIEAAREHLRKPAQHNIRNATLDEIADKIGKMPFGDTAASFAVWIREQKT